MAKKTRRNDRLTPRKWLHLLFRQPPVGLYHQPSVYLCGKELELEGFRRIVAYDEGKLCVEYSQSLFTIYGDELKILTLSAHRLTLQGRFLRTDFSDK